MDHSHKSGRDSRVGPASGLRLSCFGPSLGLHLKSFRNDRPFCRQLLLKQSSWLNLQ